MPRSFSKWDVLGGHLAQIITCLPRRLGRLAGFLAGRHPFRVEGSLRKRVVFRSFEFILLVLDLPGLYNAYIFFMGAIKPAIRPLRAEEIRVARSVFGDSLRYDLILLDSRSRFVARRQRIAYVSMHLVNYWKELPAPVLIHELVHVWQYERMGAAYVAGALYAQHSREGYDYGGPARLGAVRQRGEGLRHFNLEQQAEILEDYYRLKNGQRSGDARSGPGDIAVFVSYVKEILTEAE